jgi:tRNA-2-methylthio-N6-dimethylallyladenosine synthase
MTGCNNFCAYCVVPYARGREVSRPQAEIVAEIKNLVQNGFKEIILLGQNVNSYQDGKINFSKLLKKINALPGNFWIHFTSSHPKDVTDEFIETVTKCKKICEDVHLPIQSGSDEIISKMNRKYTVKHYLGLVKKIRAAFAQNKPGVIFALSSDIIVGFPGETKKLFLASAAVMEKIPYDMVFFGQYSPRPGTAAWKMKDTVSKKEKERREKYLNGILAESALKNNKKYVGKVFDVLVETKKGGNYFGKTRTMKNVKFFSAKNNLIGNFAKVRITKISAWNLEGEFIK